MGRSTHCLQSFNAQVDQQALLSTMDKKMSTFFGVTGKTLGKWKQKHPEFLRSTTRGKTMANAMVAEALFQRGLGYSHPEEKIKMLESRL